MICSGYKECSKYKDKECSSIKLGKTKKGTQRFKCKFLDRTVTLKDYHFRKKDLEFLTILNQLVRNDMYGAKTLEEALSNVNIKDKIIDASYIDYDDGDKHVTNGNIYEYMCKNPRLLVCIEENKLKIYRIKPVNRNYKQRNKAFIKVHETDIESFDKEII